jgi:NDP-sugar pyrophosphorylase family protein
VGSCSILEIILRQLASFSVAGVTLCVSYLAEMIMNKCGDGRRFGVDVDYCVDTERRGTAGPLPAVRDWTSPAVVTNADILTRLNFADLFDCHVANSALLTVAAHGQELCVGLRDPLPRADQRVLGMLDNYPCWLRRLCHECQ